MIQQVLNDMKIFLIAVTLLALAFSANAEMSTNAPLTVTNLPAHLKTKVSLYEGKEDSGVAAVDINFTPETTYPERVEKSKIVAPGHAAELKWRFVRRDNDKDIYHFTFKHLAETGATNLTLSAKMVEFDGKKVVVFRDPQHTVVMEIPNDEDLKAAQRN